MVKSELNFDIVSLLSDERVNKIYNKLIIYKERYGGDVRETRIDNEGDEDYAKALVLKYSICTSFLLGILNDNISGRRIVEVGPGYAGRFMLDYLTEQGADAWGIDLNSHTDYSGPSHGRYRDISWDRISEIFSPESLDIVHVKSMYSDPCPLEIKKDAQIGNFFQRRKVNKYISGLNSRIVENTHKVLKHRGYFILWHKDDDFNLNPKFFNKKGYQHERFNLRTDNRIPGFELDIFQKD
ncbi:MAG: hypothetical protein Q7R52_01330 [archaeon]|nr:hypothetical protein [archaeon]